MDLLPIDRALRRYACAVPPLLVCLGLTSSALAQQTSDLQPSFSLRGFGTVGLARSTNGQAEVTRDSLQPRGISDDWSGKIDSNIGVQANYMVSETVEAVIQAVSRYNYRDNFSPEVTEAFVRYEPNAYLELRGGRFGTDFFMRGDSRLVGYAQPTVRPNIDYYASHPMTFLDGVNIQLTVPFGDGLVRGEAYFGASQEKIPFPTGYFSLKGAQTLGGNLDYLEGNWQWRAGFTQLRFKHPMAPPVGDLREALINTGVASAQKAADELDLVGRHVRYYTLGAVYENGPLVAQAMLGRLRHDSSVIQGQIAGMFLASYRVGDLTPFAGYSFVRSHAKHLTTGLPNSGSSAALNAMLASIMADSHADQHTVSAGVRWDFQRDAALKFQVDAIRGTPDSIHPVRRETSRWNGKTSVFSIALDFVF